MKTKTAHTPGPWRMGYKDGEIWEDETTIWAGHRCIANTVAAGPQGALQYQSEATANARLIAAAPDLLNALEIAEATIQRLAPDGSRATQGTRDVIRAAIAKALGK